LRILLTGGNGFVGSHVLDELLRLGHEVTVLLRKTSDTRFIEGALGRARVVYGDVQSAESLQPAVRDAEAVVHCAGKTKAVRKRDYYAVNALGTQGLVEACNKHARDLRRFVLISSLAASGPGTSQAPAREDGPARPVTAYGDSKLKGEQFARRALRSGCIVLRPAAVYGPRDGDFLVAFKTVAGGVAPLIKGGRQRVSLVYVADLVRAVVAALEAPQEAAGVYHVAHPLPLTQRELLETIAEAMGKRPFYVPMPAPLLYVAFAVRDLVSRVTRKPSIVNLGKIPEYTAPGWVCSTERAASRLGFTARTPIEEGVRLTLRWYIEHGWLKEGGG